jgi:hypothetical protein
MWQFDFKKEGPALIPLVRAAKKLLADQVNCGGTRQIEGENLTQKQNESANDTPLVALANTFSNPFIEARDDHRTVALILFLCIVDPAETHSLSGKSCLVRTSVQNEDDHRSSFQPVRSLGIAQTCG